MIANLVLPALGVLDLPDLYYWEGNLILSEHTREREKKILGLHFEREKVDAGSHIFCILFPSP